MHAIKARSRHDADHLVTGTDRELQERLEWVSSTAAAHRAAIGRLAAARTETERREAAYEEALTKEMHRAAVSRFERVGSGGGVGG